MKFFGEKKRKEAGGTDLPSESATPTEPLESHAPSVAAESNTKWAFGKNKKRAANKSSSRANVEAGYAGGTPHEKKAGFFSRKPKAQKELIDSGINKSS